MNHNIRNALLEMLKQCPRIFGAVGIVKSAPEKQKRKNPADGLKVAFTLAVERGSNTDYFRIISWGALAENCLDEIRVKDTIMVVGEARSHTYPVKCCGKEIECSCGAKAKQRIYEINAEDVEFVEREDES